MENDHHLSEEQVDWEQIQSPFSAITAQMIDENDNQIVVKDDFFSESAVFPPGNHEDLPTGNPQENHEERQERDSNHLSIRRWKRLNLGVLRIGIFDFVRKFRKYVTLKVGVWSCAWTAVGVATVVLVSLLHRRVLIWWQRRVQLESSKESLMVLIREKDKKISQLLLQIAQMNENLIARRRVPVIRVK
ncbi:hypothetical protein CDL12_22193 [Handroanthus impetiginosus]|uniref:Transmembrane protein n=1 Tax=Handroanthus impetiginosus TaxID=429701 RepID=A0A2G9GIZ5_9LAMI|nr:hypothetical protein CDL12_22193 [Handroanthus impetiginosus]